MNKIYWMKKAASPPKILQILFILSKNKVDTCRTRLSGHFLQSVQSPKISTSSSVSGFTTCKHDETQNVEYCKRVYMFATTNPLIY